MREIILTIIFCGLISFLFLYRGISEGEQKENEKIIPDTVYIEVPILNEERIKELEGDIEYWRCVVDSINSTIPFDTYMNARKIEKIKYYISICDKNANNKKFFFGWVKRAVSEE